MHKKTILVAIIAVIIASGGSFWGGMRYEKSQTKDNQFSGRNFSGERNNSNIPNNKSGGEQGIRRNSTGPSSSFINGEITAKDDQSITVKLRDGSSKIIYLADSTEIGKTVDGQLSDLAVGQNIMVNGQNDSSGALTAQNIQIRPSEPQLVQ